MSTDVSTVAEVSPIQERGLLVPQEDVPAFIGTSRAGLFRLKATPGFPAPVRVPGIGVVYRRADLEKWVTSLKGDRRIRRVVPNRRRAAPPPKQSGDSAGTDAVVQQPAPLSPELLAAITTALANNVDPAPKDAALQ